MSILGVCRNRLTQALIVAASATVLVSTARAQMLPPTPPQGAWGEVIMANKRWIVVQNNLGQQFPINIESIAQFLIRWPTQLSALTGIPQATISAVENGRVNLGVERAKVFARALKCHPAVLVFPGWEIPLKRAA